MLPALGPAEGVTKQHKDHIVIAGGKEVILLVEDEKAVRNLSRKILEMKGYKVLEADTGAKAVLICTEYQGKIHLLLTDSVMPQISGEDLSNRRDLLHAA